MAESGSLGEWESDDGHKDKSLVLLRSKSRQEMRAFAPK